MNDRDRDTMIERGRGDQYGRAEVGGQDHGRSDRLGRWDWDVETGELHWSGPIFRIFGVWPDEFGGDLASFMERVHPGDRERIEEAVRRALEEDEPYSVYHRIVRPDGTERLVHEQAEVIRDGAGNAVRMAGTVEDITEWRQTREALRLRDAAIDSCITPIVMLDRDQRLSYVNDAFVELVQASDESELLGRPGIDLAADPELFEEVLVAIGRDGSWQGKLDGRRMDGTRIEALVSAAAVRPVTGAGESIVASILDVTDLRETERELRRREGDLSEILSSIDSVVYRDWFRCGHVDARPGFVSPPIERLVGRTPAELEADPELWFELVHPEDRQLVMETIRAARVSGLPRTFEYRVHHHPSGARRWVEESVRPELGEDGTILGMFGTIRDVTDRKESEQQRDLLQERVRSVAREWSQTFDSIEVPIFLVRWNGTVRRLNTAAAELVRGGFVGALDRRLGELADGEPWRSAADLVAEVRRAEESLFREVRDPASGTTWHLTVSPAFPEDPGRPRWLVAIFRDVTELYRLQETLRRTEKMSAMGALVARVAHEVRNPLFGISATVDALVAEFGDDRGLAEFLEVLQGEVGRMSRVMEDLLDYGRPVALDVAPTPLTEVVRAAVTACRPAAEAAGVALDLEVPDDGPMVEVDPNRLRQVFQNLMENAVQHSQNGGRVVVRADGGRPGNGVRVRVEDRGPGLGGEDPERLVEPFYSRRRGGTGLGLWIVQRILSEHGGTLLLADRKEGGAVAEVRLPRKFPVQPEPR